MGLEERPVVAESDVLAIVEARAAPPDSEASTAQENTIERRDVGTGRAEESSTAEGCKEDTAAGVSALQVE